MQKCYDTSIFALIYVFYGLPVRDLLGLKCALLYYPVHLATAIAMGEVVKSDFIRINGTKFLVCDPTYIGAPIGMTMPDMDNKTAKVIVL